ncbi:MAG TPA: universal stress protein [Planctomycetota bacterium]|nr:universal stress protein [Planctomycetota bacterium]
MFEKILVPLDGSPLSAKILALVEPVARAGDAEVRAVRVLDVYEIDEALLEGIDIFEDTKTSLEKAIDPLLQAGIDAKFEILESDDTPRRITDYAKEWGADLIALSTHGRAGADKWQEGSVAEDVARLAPCPTIAANPRALDGWRGWQTILVAIDGSELAERAVPVAAALAHAFEAKLVLFHARDGMFEKSEPDDAAILERTRALLEGIPVKTVSLKGSAGQGIIAASRAEGADAIVLATHGRAGLAHFMLGSVSEDVLEKGELPVIIIPGRAAPRAERESSAARP